MWIFSPHLPASLSIVASQNRKINRYSLVFFLLPLFSKVEHNTNGCLANITCIYRKKIHHTRVFSWYSIVLFYSKADIFLSYRTHTATFVVWTFFQMVLITCITKKRSETRGTIFIILRNGTLRWYHAFIASVRTSVILYMTVFFIAWYAITVIEYDRVYHWHIVCHRKFVSDLAQKLKNCIPL